MNLFRYVLTLYTNYNNLIMVNNSIVYNLLPVYFIKNYTRCNDCFKHKFTFINCLLIYLKSFFLSSVFKKISGNFFTSKCA